MNNNNNNNNNGIINSSTTIRANNNKRNRNRNRNVVVVAICFLIIGFLLGSSFQYFASYKYWMITAETKTATTDAETTTTTAVETTVEVQVQVQVQVWNHYPILQPYNKYNPYWLVVSHSRKLAITIIPKAMCTTIRDAFNNKLEHCGQSLPTRHPVDHNADSDSAPNTTNTTNSTTTNSTTTNSTTTNSTTELIGYNNNTLPLKISKTIPKYKQIQLNEKKMRMIKNSNNNDEDDVIGRCTEARRNPELTYDNSMYLQDENYTTVLLIRDPFERAYSAYQNSNVNIHIYLDNNNNNDGDHGVCYNTTKCTFEMWVNKLVNFRKSNDTRISKNEHFKTQTEIAQLNEIKYHYMLRMTSSKDLTFFFKNLIGLQNGVPKEHANSSGGGRRRHRSRRLQQQKNNNINNNNNNNVTVVTVVTTTNNNNSNSKNSNSTYYTNNKVLTLFESIPSRTMNQLARLYENDLQLWQEVLDYGTPRSPGEEITLYDYYISDQKI
jgi:hypothetical protein